MDAMQFIFSIFMFLGIIGILVSPAAPLIMNQKLTASEYNAQVFTPSIISLILIIIAYLRFSYLNYDEIKLKYMIIFSSLGAILISLLSIGLSLNRIHYAAF